MQNCIINVYICIIRDVIRETFINNSKINLIFANKKYGLIEKYDDNLTNNYRNNTTTTLLTNHENNLHFYCNIIVICFFFGIRSRHVTAYRSIF